MGNNRSEVQSIYLGPTGSVKSFNESLSEFPYPNMLGDCFRMSSAWFQVVQFATTQSGASVSGRLAYWYSQDDFQVTNHPELATGALGGATGSTQVAGLIVGAPTAGNLGIIQKAGKSIVNCFAMNIGVGGFPAYAVSVGLYAVTPGYGAQPVGPGSWVSSLNNPTIGANIVAVWRTSTAAATAVARADLLLRTGQ